MKSVALGVVAVGLTAAVVIFAQPEPVPIDPAAASWKVEADKSVRWSLTCRVMAEKVTRSAYNPHDWVNRMDRAGKGPDSGQLVTDNGRCTLTKTAGKGPATLTLVKSDQRQAQTTDIGRKPAYAEVF
jgi:hypothetical protein